MNNGVLSVYIANEKYANSVTRIPRNAVSCLPALCRKKEVNLKSLPFLRNKS